MMVKRSVINHVKSRQQPTALTAIPLLHPAGFRKQHISRKAIFSQLYQSDFQIFHIHALEDIRAHLKLPTPPHKKTVIDFVFVKRGKALRSSGFESYEVLPDTFFFLPVNAIGATLEMSEDIEGYYCHFDEAIFDERIVNKQVLNEFSFLQTDHHPLVTPNPSALCEIQHLLVRLHQLYQANEPNRMSIISLTLLSLFFELNAYRPGYPSGRVGAAHTLVHKFKELVKVQATRYHEVHYYAEQLAVSHKYLTRCVLSVLGKSPKEIVIEMILLEAKVLLLQSTLTVAEVAYRVGFEDPGYFTRLFRRHTLLSPSAFRQKA